MKAGRQRICFFVSISKIGLLEGGCWEAETMLVNQSLAGKMSQIYQTVFKATCPKKTSMTHYVWTNPKPNPSKKEGKKGLARTLHNPLKFLTSDFQTHTFLLIRSLYFFVCFYIVTKEAAQTLICYRWICYYYKRKTRRKPWLQQGAQERPLGFNKWHGGDGVLPSKLGTSFFISSFICS